jgi:RNA polymerase sigma-70 factor, ECF subfamily
VIDSTVTFSGFDSSIVWSLRMKPERHGEWLAGQFEENRGRLRALAYRMLGSAAEADDAVQESWLRLSRSDAGIIENLGGWLTTVVSRVCLDMLRSRTAKREEALETTTIEPMASAEKRNDPEHETLISDSVGVAVLIVLDRLHPAERIAFVLHDMFAISFEEIAAILGRSPDAARQIASRARRRVQGAPAVPTASYAQQRQAVKAFLDALRKGDFEGLVAALDPDVVVRIDEASARAGAPREIRGARNWAKGAIAFSRQAVGSLQTMLVDGEVGLVWAPRGRVQRVVRLLIAAGKIAEVEIIGNQERFRELELAVIGEQP